MAEPASQRITPVILCGGAGMRLWPLSRLDRPKPFVALNGAETLFQETARRVADRARFTAPTVVAAREYEAIVREQLAEIGVDDAYLILEPCARGTAAAITMGALNSNPGDLQLVLPSDHFIKNIDAFQTAVEAAAAAAEQGWIVTFGVIPERAETGYGYILHGEETSSGVFRVDRFVEKPDGATAADYLADGRYLWNSGIFLFNTRRMLHTLSEHAAYIFPAAGKPYDAGRRDHDSLYLEPVSFAALPSQSIDHAVMEKSKHVAVVPVDMGWSDVGSWEALHAIADKDAADNVLAGDVVMIDSAGSLVRSEGPLVVGVGVRDMVVVATERSVLIVPLGESQRVKEAVEALIRRGHKPPPELEEEEG